MPRAGVPEDKGKTGVPVHAQVTVRQAEDVPFERMQKARQTTEEKRAEKEDLKSALAGSDKSAVVGRSGSASLLLSILLPAACLCCCQQ